MGRSIRADFTFGRLSLRGSIREPSELRIFDDFYTAYQKSQNDIFKCVYFSICKLHLVLKNKLFKKQEF